MEMGIIRGIITLLVLLLFLGIWAWSWSRKRQPEFDAASRLPLDNDSHPPRDEAIKEQQS